MRHWCGPAGAVRSARSPTEPGWLRAAGSNGAASLSARAVRRRAGGQKPVERSAAAGAVDGGENGAHGGADGVGVYTDPPQGTAVDLAFDVRGGLRV